MQQSTNINDLLEQWDQYRNCSIPVPCTLQEALEFTEHKTQINKLVHNIQNDRFNSSSSIEDEQQFVKLFESFSREYVYKILKNV